LNQLFFKNLDEVNMFEISSFALFISAAAIFAFTPGPGIIYIFTRSLKGGRHEGITSAIGTSIGGFGHVLFVVAGLSTILTASALAFNIIKYAGAIYLFYLWFRSLYNFNKVESDIPVEENCTRRFLHQGFMNELLNPKTPLFFSAFVPQFINPAGNFILQFILLGCTSVILNLSADLIVASFIGSIGKKLKTSLLSHRRQGSISGLVLIGLGIFTALPGQKK
jgi:threonine/homoserine/homoserine lactone efflux protein